MYNFTYEDFLFLGFIIFIFLYFFLLRSVDNFTTYFSHFTPSELFIIIPSPIFVPKLIQNRKIHHLKN